MISLKEICMSMLRESASPQTIHKITSALTRFGGKVFTVGGAVRDELLGIPSKDVDFLVTGLPLDKIAQILSGVGKVSEVGKSFGIVKAVVDGQEFDVAIPRTKEIKTGDKHTDFQVQTDPNASAEDDLSRRDFTINALAKDSNGKVIDLFGGQQDLQNRVIRAVGNAKDRFSEDPLRMLRAMQFAVRFDFSIEDGTLEAIKSLKGKLSSVAPERVGEEFKKAWTKGKNPQRFIEILKETGVGKMLFGQEFNPIPIAFQGTPEEIVIANFISFFVNGGDHLKMRPTSEMSEMLAISRDLVKMQKQPWENLGKHSDKLQFFIRLFTQMAASSRSTEIRKALEALNSVGSLPVSFKDLKITGADLMQMGYKGKDVGMALRSIMGAIHARQIVNDKQQIVNFIQKRESRTVLGRILRNVP